MKTKWIRITYGASAIYDLVLGIAFLFGASALFKHFEVTPPNHLGYVHFPALLLILFAVLYARIALDPIKNRGLMPYGMGLKAAYILVAFYHQIMEGIPAMWLPFAYADAVFLILFLLGWRATKQAQA